MSRFGPRALLLSLSLAFAVAAHAQTPPQERNGVLVNEAGMTVYTFDKDEPNSGKSNCYDQCAQNWPPVIAAPGSKPQGDYSIIMRNDGQGQWAYRGQPLYTFIKDKQPGERNGDNARDVWHVVKP